MNPDNNSLSRTYFIGGPPRVGKTILATKLSNKINGHVVTTDAIRDAVKKASLNPENDIYIVNKQNNLSEADWIEQHLYKPEDVVKIQNTESIAFSESIIGFCNSFCEDDLQHIVEGVAITPQFVENLKNRPKNILFVGNTNPNLYKFMQKYSEDNPQRDWMNSMGYSNEKIRAMSVFVNKMSEYFKDEAKKYGFNYFDFTDYEFEKGLELATQLLIAKS